MAIKPNEIYNCDFFEIESNIEDDSIDLVICDGPYGILNTDWDRISNIQEFNLKLIEIFSRKMKYGASLYLFGKQDCIDFIDYRKYLNLDTRIIWGQFCRLHQGKKKYTDNYDVICYFVKGKKKTFNLEDIRVPQMTSKQHMKTVENAPSVKNGKWNKTKFNENGKNPGNVWTDIKPLTYHSKELERESALNTVQKPIVLFDRLIKASSNEDDVILDPFCGTGSSLVSAKKLGRKYIGIEKDKTNFDICIKRTYVLT